LKEIVVVSGKGGAGKSTVTAALSYFLDKNDVLIDADVDAPNMKILLEPKTIKKEDFYSGKEFKIETEVCTNCGKCYEECAFNAIDFLDSYYVIDQISCESCGLCQFICPVNAVSDVPKLTGKKFLSYIKYGFPMVHASLNPAEENSGKLVTDIKKMAKTIAEEQEAKIILIDGPPGIGCSAISAISGSDTVLLVVESSISGLHDMERLIELVKKFNIPKKGFINKFGVNPEIDEKVIHMFEKNDVDIIGYLNFSEKIPELLKKRQILTEDKFYYKNFENVFLKLAEEAK